MGNFLILTIMMVLIGDSEGAGFCEVEEKTMVCEGTVPQHYFRSDDVDFPLIDRFEGSNIHVERVYFSTVNFPNLKYVDIKQSTLTCDDVTAEAIIIIDDTECIKSSSSLPTPDHTLTNEKTTKMKIQTSEPSTINPSAMTNHPSSSHKIPATSTITLQLDSTSQSSPFEAWKIALCVLSVLLVTICFLVLLIKICKKRRRFDISDAESNVIFLRDLPLASTSDEDNIRR